MVRILSAYGESGTAVIPHYKRVDHLSNACQRLGFPYTLITIIGQGKGGVSSPQPIS